LLPAEQWWSRRTPFLRLFEPSSEPEQAIRQSNALAGRGASDLRVAPAATVRRLI
jgi:hypothetical protein